MSLSDFVNEYTPDMSPELLEIARQLEGFNALLSGFGAGPQKPDDPDQRQRISVLIENPWREEQWVTIYSASYCEYWSEGETYHLTLADLFDYLRQLPRPLHTFGKFQP
jgi:hypothetical protein